MALKDQILGTSVLVQGSASDVEIMRSRVRSVWQKTGDINSLGRADMFGDGKVHLSSFRRISDSEYTFAILDRSVLPLPLVHIRMVVDAPSDVSKWRMKTRLVPTPEAYVPLLVFPMWLFSACYDIRLWSVIALVHSLLYWIACRSLFRRMSGKKSDLLESAIRDAGFSDGFLSGVKASVASMQA